MKKNSVKVYHTNPKIYYDDVNDTIKDLFEKFGDILIDWKLATNKCGEFIIWYVVRDTNNTSDEKTD